MRSPASDALNCSLLNSEHSNGGYTPVTFRGDGGTVGPRDRATHLAHWYPAKMFHRIPLQILEVLKPTTGSVVFDPFCGSGTVLLEAILDGHQAVGVDINPLARMISRVKTTPLDQGHIKRHARSILQRMRQYRSEPSDEQIPEFWFKRDQRIVLHRLHRSIL